MSKVALPKGFQDLEPFVENWALSREVERNRQRRSSTIEQLQEFYDAILPRMDEIVGYLNQFSLDEMPKDAQRLLNMGLSLMEIAPAIELLGEPDESGVFEAERFHIVEPGTGQP